MPGLNELLWGLLLLLVSADAQYGSCDMEGLVGGLEAVETSCCNPGECEAGPPSRCSAVCAPVLLDWWDGTATNFPGCEMMKSMFQMDSLVALCRSEIGDDGGDDGGDTVDADCSFAAAMPLIMSCSMGGGNPAADPNFVSFYRALASFAHALGEKGMERWRGGHD